MHFKISVLQRSIRFLDQLKPTFRLGYERSKPSISRSIETDSQVRLGYERSKPSISRSIEIDVQIGYDRSIGIDIRNRLCHFNCFLDAEYICMLFGYRVYLYFFACFLDTKYICVLFEDDAEVDWTQIVLIHHGRTQLLSVKPVGPNRWCELKI